jgi:hypothetical protein
MTAVVEEASGGSATALTDPWLHTRVTDHLPADHQLATRRISCERCETILHLQNNRCVRTWVESGRGNYCLYCFVVAVGELAPTSTRLPGAERLPSRFALRKKARTGAHPV